MLLAFKIHKHNLYGSMDLFVRLEVSLVNTQLHGINKPTRFLRNHHIKVFTQLIQYWVLQPSIFKFYLMQIESHNIFTILGKRICLNIFLITAGLGKVNITLYVVLYIVLSQICLQYACFSFEEQLYFILYIFFIKQSGFTIFFTV